MELDLRTELTSLMVDDAVDARVRAPIAASWRRSRDSGLAPDRFVVPFRADHDLAEELIRAADPVVSQLVEDLGDSALSVLLSDDTGTVARRWVHATPLLTRLDQINLSPGFDYGEGAIGTNAIGTALAAESACMVVGGEHFADELSDMACAAAPVIDPATSTLRGIVDVTCRARDAHVLMLPVVRQAAADIARELVVNRSTRQQDLQRRFEAIRRRARGPVALVARDAVLTNTAAARLLSREGGERIWQTVVESSTTSGCPVAGVATTLDGSQLQWTAEPVVEDGQVIAAVVSLLVEAPAAGPESLTTLTESEQTIAELVAAGLSNRDVAARLLVSPHTVDAHLRRIYSKLGISSRVQLARFILLRDDPDSQ